jgi:ABC-type uncharacterized transport system ATPase component
MSAVANLLDDGVDWLRHGQSQGFRANMNSALESGGVLLGDEVTIALDVQFVKG